MAKVIAAITTSVDGFITGPDDGPGYGLGKGGERLHYWVMGGPWTYEGGHDFAMHGPDKDFYDELVAGLGAGIVGRGMYDAAGAWGGTNPFPGPLMVLTHRVQDQSADATGFTFVSGLEEALARALAEAGGKDVSICHPRALHREEVGGDTRVSWEQKTGPADAGPVFVFRQCRR